MPKLVNRYPAYCLFKPLNRARVRHQGKTYWMPGAYNSPQSLRAYADFIEGLKVGETPEARDKLKDQAPANVLTIAELVERFWAHCLVHYRRNGEPTGEAAVIQCALRPLLELCGDILAVDCRPSHLEMVREDMIRRGWSRRYINRSVGRIKRLFNWATSKEHVPASVSGAIAAVKGLEQHRSMAREKPEIEPVDDAVVEATLPELPAMVADMIRVQRLLGCRPGGLLAGKPSEIDRRNPDCWEYRPRFHKTLHKGKKRLIFIGPRAQAILAPYVLAAGDGRIFTYTRDGFRQAIYRACDRAFPHPKLAAIPADDLTPKQDAELTAWRKSHRWHPNRLRHSAETAIREQFGLDHAQAVAGHSHASTTEVYAKVSAEKAKQVAMAIG